MGDAQISLFSFEIKIKLSFSNLRESFFQAVSNSSWAHQGYLVTANVREDRDFLIELERLSRSFGIGVLLLDLEDPDSTDELFPPEENEVVDWDTVDKLMMNPDFREFISRVKRDVNSKEVREEWYDQINEAEEIIEFFKNRL